MIKVMTQDTKDRIADLERQKIALEDQLELVEANEAFAAQSLAVIKELGISKKYGISSIDLLIIAKEILYLLLLFK